MNVLYELFCMGAAPPVTTEELKRANFQQFMNKSLASAKYVTGDEHLRQEATMRAKTLLGQKSHSATNTVRTIKTMFDAAKRACEFGRERCMVEWLETCVTLAVQYGLQDKGNGVTVPTTYDKIGASEEDEEDEVVLAKKPAASKTRRVQRPRRKAKTYSSDGEYCPTDEDEEDSITVPILDEDEDEQDQKVPVIGANGGGGGKNKNNGKKKKNNKPKQPEPAIITAINPGAGSQAVVKYFATTQNGVLQNGYFCRSYFFPSKESYSIFLSVLGSAKSTLEVCVYSLTDDDTANCLIAAKQRGVKIRIITDDQQAASQYADAARLQRDHGIPYKDDHSISSYMHNKFAVIDGKILINGSFNWSRNARFKNRENIMITNIPDSIKEFQGEFEKLWNLF